ncbi:MAG: T9SS type A sorting domain-containing protein [Bacteroidetes bacterium]|nr:MAG: T9SS type A sorting domain-containing protein [Bacteroidota bacterium]
MKSKLLLTSIILASTPLVNAQSDNWQFVSTNGFDQSTQNTVPEMEVFQGMLFASTSPSSGGFAKLWHTENGESGTWSDNAQFNPPLNMDKSIHSFGSTTLGGGYIWLGTGSGKGAAIYRSQDGVNWIQISKRGFGNPELTGAAPHMMVFQGSTDSIPYLYAGAGSHGAGASGQVWRTPYNNTDSSKWSLVVDFATIDAGTKTITYFEVWQDKIYFGTDNGGQLWESTDGTFFSQNQGVGNGFDSPGNKVISSIEVYQNELYVSTNNPGQGGQIWKSGDGLNWNFVTKDAFGKGKEAFELRSLRESFGKLWVTAYTDTAISTGTPIWRTGDGVQWEQSNEDGFGNPNNSGENPVTIGFGDYQYFGGPNYKDGGQIWRAKIGNSSLSEKHSEKIFQLYPNPFHESATLKVNSVLPVDAELLIYDLQGNLIRREMLSHTTEFQIRQKNLEPGTYLLEVNHHDQKIERMRIIIL